MSLHVAGLPWEQVCCCMLLLSLMEQCLAAVRGLAAEALKGSGGCCGSF